MESVRTEEETGREGGGLSSSEDLLYFRKSLQKGSGKIGPSGGGGYGPRAGGVF